MKTKDFFHYYEFPSERGTTKIGGLVAILQLHQYQSKNYCTLLQLFLQIDFFSGIDRRAEILLLTIDFSIKKIVFKSWCSIQHHLQVWRKIEKREREKEKCFSITISTRHDINCAIMQFQIVNIFYVNVFCKNLFICIILVNFHNNRNEIRWVKYIERKRDRKQFHMYKLFSYVYVSSLKSN